MNGLAMKAADRNGVQETKSGEYEKGLRKLQGGAIRAITERISPCVFQMVARPVPSDREKSQMYFQCYMTHFPAAGEVVIFDRSCYSRAGVEPVMDFCTKEQYDVA